MGGTSAGSRRHVGRGGGPWRGRRRHPAQGGSTGARPKLHRGAWGGPPSANHVYGRVRTVGAHPTMVRVNNKHQRTHALPYSHTTRLLHRRPQTCTARLVTSRQHPVPHTLSHTLPRCAALHACAHRPAQSTSSTPRPPPQQSLPHQTRHRLAGRRWARPPLRLGQQPLLLPLRRQQPPPRQRRHAPRCLQQPPPHPRRRRRARRHRHPRRRRPPRDAHPPAHWRHLAVAAGAPCRHCHRHDHGTTRRRGGPSSAAAARRAMRPHAHTRRGHTRRATAPSTRSGRRRWQTAHAPTVNPQPCHGRRRWQRWAPPRHPHGAGDGWDCCWRHPPAPRRHGCRHCAARRRRRRRCPDAGRC